MAESADSRPDGPVNGERGRDAAPGQEFSFRQIQVFLALAHCGSFTKAAAVIHLSQSGMSRAIASLEREVGVPLFMRGSNALYLSAAGKAFYPLAKRLADSYARTLNIMRPSAPEKPWIACSCMVVPALLKSMGKAESAEDNLPLRVKAMGSHKVLAAVLNGEVDLGVCMVGVLPEGLHAQTVFSAPLGLLANPGLSLPHTIEAWEDLQHLRYARLVENMVLPAMLCHQGLKLPAYLNADLLCDNMPSLISAVASAPCVTFVSEVAAQHTLAKGLVFKALPRVLPRLRLCIVSREMEVTDIAVELSKALIEQYSMHLT